MKKFGGAVCFGVGLLACSPVGAQTSPSDTSADTASTEAGGEIIVTAQRRAENARDVPVSLTVADGPQLERAGVRNILDLPLITPGLKIDRFGVSTQPTIRGITTRENSPGNDANVAIYVDGVYQASQAANGFDLPDIVRVEVSKGPQGTLFGRNAAGGAIQIFTAQPTYEFGGNASASYGRFEDISLKGRVNIPLVDGLAALSVFGFHQQTDGYYRDVLNGGSFGKIDSSLVRGKLLVEPAPWLTLNFAGQYSHREDEAVGAGSPLNGNAAARRFPGTIIPTRPYDVAVNSPFTTVRNMTGSFKADADLGFANLGLTTAYQDVDIDFRVEGDFTSANLSRFAAHVFSKTFTQEAILTSPDAGARFNWVLGAFYYHNKGAFDPLNVEANGNIVLSRFGLQRTKAYAAFGEANFKLTDRLTVIAGLRYSYEKHFLSGHTGAAPDADLAEKAFDAVTPRLSLVYEVVPRTNVYFTYSKGFKSGGFITSGLAGLTPFDPENVTAYEVGLKTQPSNALRFNAAAFFYDYSDQQVLTIVQQANGVQAQVTRNAATSEIYGLEADLQADLTDELSATVATSLLHARYTDYRNALVQVPRTVNGVVCLCGNVGVTLDASGNQLIRAPDFTASGSLNYRRELSAGLIDLSTTLYYSSKYVFTSDERVAQPDFVNLGARASFQPAGSAFKFSVWGQNLTDSTVIEGTSTLPNGDGVFYAKPRTYGVAVDVTF